MGDTLRKTRLGTLRSRLGYERLNYFYTTPFDRVWFDARTDASETPEEAVVCHWQRFHCPLVWEASVSWCRLDESVIPVMPTAYGSERAVVFRLRRKEIRPGG